MDAFTDNTTEILGLQSSDRVMAVVPHGDDESMFMGQTIGNLVKENIYVVGVTATDGEQHGEPATRRQEVHAAYETLGIPTYRRAFLGLPDSELHIQENVLTLARRIGDIATLHGITTILTPGWEGIDGHSDHIAAHIATVIAAVELYCEDRQITILASRGDGGGKYAVPVNADEKIGLLQVYTSQFGDFPREVAEQAYPSYLVYESYDPMETLQDIGRALLNLGSLDRRIPEFQLADVN